MKFDVDNLIFESVEKFKSESQFCDQMTIKELHDSRNYIFREAISHFIDETDDQGYQFEELGRLVYKLNEELSSVIMNDFIAV